jgi:glyoxylase I family protein
MSEHRFVLHHASLIVSNVEASLGFYRDVLGLEQIERPDLGFAGAWLSLGDNQQLHLLELPNPDPTTGRPVHGGRDRHVALTTPSLAVIKALLDKANWVYTLSISGRKALFCRDLDGNAIEIIER